MDRYLLTVLCWVAAAIFLLCSAQIDMEPDYIFYLAIILAFIPALFRKSKS